MKKSILLSAFLICSVWISNGQWSYNNLTEPKYRMGGAASGTKAYFAGGQCESGQVSAVEIYDVQEEAWDSTINLSVPRSHPACVAAGNKVFFAGGINFYTMEFYDDVDIWDTEAKEWTVEHLLFPRFSIGAVSFGNKVMFAGGADLMNGKVFDIVEIYDVETGSWTFNQLSMARCAFAYAVAGDLAIFAGGFDLVTVTDRVDIYNFTTNTWTTASLSEPRGFLAAAVVGHKVFIAGGVRPDNVNSDRVDIYDTETNTWDTASLSSARSMFQEDAASVCDNKAYFTGGGNFNLNTLDWETVSDVIDIYDTSGTRTVDYLSEAVLMHSAVGVQDHLVVAGGLTLSMVEWQWVSTVQIYIDPDCSVGVPEVRSSQFTVRSYPNPTRGIVDFRLSMAAGRWVSLKIYDVQGIEVAVVLDEDLPAGERTVKWDAEAMPAGIYFYRLSTNKCQRLTCGKLVKY